MELISLDAIYPFGGMLFIEFNKRIYRLIFFYINKILNCYNAYELADYFTGRNKTSSDYNKNGLANHGAR